MNPPYEWLNGTLERIGDLATMPEIHNSYGMPTVKAEASLAAFHFLTSRMHYVSPAPRVMPNTDGGLELTWNGVTSELRLYFHPSGSVTGSFRDLISNDSIESASLFEVSILEIEKELGIVRPPPLVITVQ